MEDVNKNRNMEPLDISESEIPWYRWRWLFVVTFFLFYPAALIIGLSGNIYGKQKGVPFKLSNKLKYILLLGGFFLMVNAILQSL